MSLEIGCVKQILNCYWFERFLNFWIILLFHLLRKNYDDKLEILLLSELRRRTDVLRRLTEELVAEGAQPRSKTKLDKTSVEIINSHIKKLLLVSCKHNYFPFTKQFLVNWLFIKSRVVCWISFFLSKMHGSRNSRKRVL